jgi:hypothetical protein
MITPSQAVRIRLAGELLAMFDSLNNLSPLRGALSDNYERNLIDEAWDDVKTSLDILIQRVA